MLNQELLLELTEAYLKALVAQTATSLGSDFDSSAPFAELGIDSFRVLKIIKSLEAEFGTLPKTLLFENFNVNDLARWFVDKHGQTLSAKFAVQLQRSSASAEIPTSPAKGSAAASEPRPIARDERKMGERDIAIVGMAGRYPKARNVRELWENLRQGRDCVENIPAERMARRTRNALTREYRGGFLDEVDRFDSLFFNISPREAEALDPQDRLFLEVAWEAIEDAGYYPETLVREGAARDIGVFVGAVWTMYQILGVEQKLGGNNVNPNSFLWSIANRVSYWMNLTGPSLTIDTACSSSLTAIYLACEAIQRGDCSAAIVGGVNLDLHQHKFDINTSGGALSSDGVCRSFGAGANGYVAGEGVGAILLKPLDRAIEDHDNIYGVIKSVVVNHGGRTSGYTVPSPKAQANLIRAALDKAGIDARSIGYIEAHGTGTELGDPVEVAGLTGAFESFNLPKHSCPIGSVKTNIGHLEAAAGVVSVCKVLLQMQYRQLVPSLHSSQLNPHIDFDSSPFYVQQRVEEWRGKEIGGATLPLRAGISSFGAGGANAHMVLEEYEAPAIEESAQPGDHLFPLSARNDEQLREMAQRLRSHLEQQLAHGESRTKQSLNSIAFTLHRGRKSFDCRVVIIASSHAALLEKLGTFLAGGKDTNILTGHVKNSERITKLLSKNEKEKFIGLLAQSRDPRKLAQLWVDGHVSDWRKLVSGSGSRRASLPTYPFADKRHWVGSDKAKGLALQARSGMHPLIDSNESTFQRQVFKKTFRAREFLLSEHVLSDIPTLPGTAYLELARKAGEIAAGGRRVSKIRNVIWMSPLTLRGVEMDVFIELKPAGDMVQFDVFSENEDGTRQRYCQGKLSYGASPQSTAEAEHIDLAGIRARCAKAIEGKDAYPLFKSLGLSYGPSFQVLREVFKNQAETLGVLELPESREADFQEFVLHPCVLDASMQAGVVGQLGAADAEMKVPYSIGEVEILQPLTRTCYSHVTQALDDKKSGSRLSRENVVIVDADGKVLVRIRDSVGVPLINVHGKAAHAAAASGDGFAKLYYSHAWAKAPLPTVSYDVGSVLLFDVDDKLRNACLQASDNAGHKPAIVLVLPGACYEALADDTYTINPLDPADYARLFQALSRKQWRVENVCYAWAESAVPDQEDVLSKALSRGVYSLLALCQSLLEHKGAGAVRILYLYFAAAQEPQPHNEAVNGFLRTLCLENPKVSGKVMEIRRHSSDPAQVWNSVLAELGPDAQDATSIRYEDGGRYTRKLEKFVADTQPQEILLKQHGAYVITGGAGGLGLIFARLLAERSRARLVLTGRSELSAERKADLDRLRGLGAEVFYVPADVSKREDAERVIQECKSRFGQINGIIHAAGVLRDSYLRKKTPEEMAAVLAPKVYGTFHLDQVTREENLDFFVLFSSLAAIGGNPGQCDYAFANHYMDSFATRREMQVRRGTRTGRTLSFNWSLWADGGMKLDPQTEIFFKESLGIKPLASTTGLAAFLNGLSLNRPQMAVLEAVQAKIEQAWGVSKKAAPARPVASTAAKGGAELSGTVGKELSRIVMELLQLGADDFSMDSILLDLGFDSIGLATFANAINARYGLDVNPVLFFEHTSISSIAEHLVAEHADAVQAAHSGAPPPLVEQPAKRQGDVDAPMTFDKSREFGAVVQGAMEQGSGSFLRELRFVREPIAIVGIAGVMPQSDSLEEFWDNLKQGRDLVTEIPRDRWIWEDHHGNPLKDVNKSNSKWGGFMREIDKFDPHFFGIAPREAEMMDPQQRIFLQTVYQAIEDSGHKVSDLSGTRTGLFVGVSGNDYTNVLAEHQMGLDGYSAAGNSHSILANRVSFLLNLRGPSAPIDTACSSSLIALHRAIESIHTGSSDMAIVGGVQVMLTPVGHISLSSAGMLSVDGRCKTFDKDANGYVRGEGAGAIFIKPLAKAEADGNPIYAVIKATAENHGGRATLLTAPNPNAQVELLMEAYDKARVDPATVGYIECHGTGTGLGDSIEIQALKKCFGELYRRHNSTPAQAPHCGLSAVKTNVGHLEPASGMASLLKVLLAMKHQQIPALLHLQELNPYISLKGSPFYIVDKLRPWDAPRNESGDTLPRRAGVSAFGWGGANAHVVLEEYIQPERPLGNAPGQPQLVVLSAKSGERLKAYAASLLAHIQKHSVELTDLAYTLQVGRDAWDERLGLIVSSTIELQEKLRAYLAGDSMIEGLHRGRALRSRRNEEIAVHAGANLERLLDAWVKGVDVDWHALDASPSRKRISLPGYPFARERYWIDTTSKQQRGVPLAV